MQGKSVTTNTVIIGTETLIQEAWDRSWIFWFYAIHKVGQINFETNFLKI
jgi:hypothetical protein